MTEQSQEQQQADAETKPDAAAIEAARKVFEAETDKAATALIAVLPEALRALVPEKLTPAQRIEWAAKALKSGVAKTDARPQTGNRDADTSRLPPTARIAAGYGKK